MMNKLTYEVLKFLEELELSLSMVHSEDFKALCKSTEAFEDFVNYSLV